MGRTFSHAPFTPVPQVLDAESMKLVKEIEAQKCDARDRPVAGVKITASGVM